MKPDLESHLPSRDLRVIFDATIAAARHNAARLGVDERIFLESISLALLLDAAAMPKREGNDLLGQNIAATVEALRGPTQKTLK